MTAEGLPRIGLPIGDPAGIGPEIVIKALARPEIHEACHPVVFGDGAALYAHAEAAGIPLSLEGGALWVNNGFQVPFRRSNLLKGGMPPMAQVSPEAGKACHGYAVAAIRAAQKGELDAVVAAPHTEAAVNAAGIPFDGYPNLVADTTETKRDDVFLMLVSPHFRIVNVTLHEPLKDAAQRLTSDLISRAIGAGLAGVARFGITDPSIGVCGLNPHAGEGGLFGTEDQAIIAPAVAEWAAKGRRVTGPHPADALLAKRGHDVYVAMYHDQAHIPFKVTSPNAGVAMSVGVPVMFCSVAHGSAHDIAGTGKADPTALINAILLMAGQFSRKAV
jgi:1,2-dihydroxy-3,5-cyclohexadiene-1,4-dicarboxylate dehydrogenase